MLPFLWRHLTGTGGALPSRGTRGTCRIFGWGPREALRVGLRQGTKWPQGVLGVLKGYSRGYFGRSWLNISRHYRYSGGTQKTQAVVDVLWTGYSGVYTRTSHPFSRERETYISASARSSRAHTHTHTPMHPRTARISDLHPCRSLRCRIYKRISRGH